MRAISTGVLLVLLAACRSGGEKTVGVGEGIRHDDVVYSVSHVSRMDGGSRLNRARPGDRLWLVVFRVGNQGKQAAHAWSESTAYVTDSLGHRYESLTYPVAKAYSTPAGQTDSTTLLFSLPPALVRPYVRVRGKMLTGDLPEGQPVENTKIRLF